jgi:hypothetical protein
MEVLLVKDNSDKEMKDYAEELNKDNRIIIFSIILLRHLP